MIIKKIKKNVYEVNESGMPVPLRIYASEKLLEGMKKDNSLQQGINVSMLPGIKKNSIMLSDAHQGYGFSIGGVAAFDLENGIITPGGIGFDINCGVRLLSSKLKKQEVIPKINELLDALFENIPPGIGKKSKFSLTNKELDEVLNEGAPWCIKKNIGNKSDLEFSESNGFLPGNAKKVSRKAKGRGLNQLGTLGAGNHFLEVQYVDKIYDETAAKIMGIEKDSVLVMIHCGSRGLGHQVCSDYLRKMEETYEKEIESLPEKDLAYAPFASEIAKDYFDAMCSAANFAWANRTVIAHQVRKSFSQVFGRMNLETIYDVAHNIAKIEEHYIDGEKKKLVVHRKGATRAFPPGHPEIPEKYREIGQPTLIPGSMGTASYVMLGSEKAMELTFGSSAHGAGRVMSRARAKKEFEGEEIKTELEKNNIHIKAASIKGITEEAPRVYKDVDEVVKVNHDLGISKLVVRLKPLGVVKG